MKILLATSIFLASFSLFADFQVFSGNNGEYYCELRLDLKAEHASLGNCSFFAWDGILERKNTLIIEGGNDFLDCKVVVILDDAKVPVKATLSTRHMLKPFYTKTVTCTDLTRIR